MQRPMDINAMRGLGRAMVADVVTDALYAVLVLVDLVVPLCGNLTPGIEGAVSYLLWSTQVASVASWATALVCLGRLVTLAPSFERARTWYVVRILVFATSAIVDSPITIQTGDLLHGSLGTTQSVLGMAACLLSLVVLPLMPAPAVQEVLEGSASLLDSCGMPDQARAGQRAARRFLAIDVAFVIVLPTTIAAVIATGLYVIGMGDTPIEQGSSVVIPAGLGLLALGMLSLGLAVGRYVSWARATGRVSSACATLEELAS